MYFIQKYWHVLLGISCVIVLGAVYFGGNLRRQGDSAVHPVPNPLVISEASKSVYATPEPGKEPETVYIQVHIVGAVQYPGVYIVPADARVNDVLTLAGGPTEEADLLRVNLADFLQDAQQIVIPLICVGGEGCTRECRHLPEPTPAAPAEPVAIVDGRIDINSADATLLQTLPGIGPVLAENIIQYRETQGPFRRVEDIRNVHRIGASIFDNIQHLIIVP